MVEILGDLIDEEYTPTVLSEAEEDEEEIVPECPPPSDEEDEPEGDEARVHAGINAVLAMSHDAISKKAPEMIVQETYASAVAASNESCLGAAAKPERLHDQIHNSPGGKILFEFACASDSALGRIGEELGVQVVRLCKEHIDLASKANIDQLVEQVKAIPGCSIHGSIECGPWSAWQRLNEAKNPRLSNILREKRRESVSMMYSFIRVANHVLDNGGFVSFEWPRYCSGWMCEPLASWITERQLLSATFDGCTVGITGKDNKPARKPWRFVTNNKRLADSLGMLKCTHDKHAPLEGKYTRNSAFYPEPLCQIMLRALFPHVVNAHVFCMPCTPRVNHSHRQHVVKGMPSVPIDVLMHESGCKEFVTPAFVHRLLERAEWKGRPEVYLAIKSKKDGLVLEGTWIEDEIRSKADVIREFPNETLHFGALMVIVSIKGYEKNPAEWKIKARIVFLR